MRALGYSRFYCGVHRLIALQRVRVYNKGNPKSDLERWRHAGYAAVNMLVDRLKVQIKGKVVEDISNLLREEGKNATAAIFEQMINKSYDPLMKKNYLLF